MMSQSELFRKLNRRIEQAYREARNRAKKIEPSAINSAVHLFSETVSTNPELWQRQRNGKYSDFSKLEKGLEIDRSHVGVKDLIKMGSMVNSVCGPFQAVEVWVQGYFAPAVVVSSCYQSIGSTVCWRVPITMQPNGVIKAIGQPVVHTCQKGKGFNNPERQPEPELKSMNLDEDEINGYQLKIMRKLFTFSVPDAAEFLGGGVSHRAWNKWENDQIEIPDDVKASVRKMAVKREEMIGALIAASRTHARFQLRLYPTFESFIAENPYLKKDDWRLLNSIQAEIICMKYYGESVAKDAQKSTQNLKPPGVTEH